MGTTIRMRITKGKIPMFKNWWSDEFIKFVDMPTFEVFKTIYRRRQNNVNEDQLNLYYEALQARYEGKTLQEAGAQIGRSKNRVHQIEQKFLRNLRWYEQHIIGG